MIYLPIKFRKPIRGEGSCESVYLEVNRGVATCLRSSHMTDFTSDGINGVLVFDGANSNHCFKIGGGKQTYVCNTLDANYYKGLGSNQDRCGVLVVSGGSELEHLVATIWKPTTANGGCADKMRLDRVGVETAAAVCARYYKGISAHGCNCVVVGDDEVLKGFNTGIGVRAVLTPDRVVARQEGRRMKNNGEPMFTLTSQDRHGVCLEYLGRCRIRKLTPRECWRLQGFPDEYFDRAVSAGTSDTQLYKQAGNAVTVSVAFAIGKRLMEIEEDG